MLLGLSLGMPAHALPSLQGKEPLKHPIVLVHGATTDGSKLKIGPLNLGEYFEGIPEFFRATGTVVKNPDLPTDGSIAERAAVLKNYLDTEMKGQMVNIVAHSIGGLDVRYMISILRSMQISSITTIGTPHRGTPLADWAMSQINGNGFWYWTMRLFGYNMSTRKFLPEITTYGMKKFNDNVPDSLEVRYFSVASRARYVDGTLSGLLWLTRGWLEGQGHYLSANGNDGMVPYDSQVWGKQVEIPVQDLDHLAQMNHHEGRLTTMKSESLMMYTKIFDNLQHEGL